MEHQICIILTTATSEESAKQMAATLVESGMAACVQISAPGTSVYRWDGAIQQEQEFYLTIKTADEARAAVCSWLEENHPYETPEIISLKGDASRAYMQWLSDHTK